MATPHGQTRPPQAGDVVLVTKAASVQYIEPFLFHISRIYRHTHTPDGWTWMDGYQLDADGRTVGRRDLFVQPDRLWVVAKPPTAGKGPASMPRTRRTTVEEAILGHPRIEHRKEPDPDA